MRRSLAAMLLVMAWTAAPAFAEKWTSADGLVTVTLPNADDFVRMEDPPDLFLVLWVSKDNNLYFGVRWSECPPGTSLTRSMAEEEFSQDWEATITATSNVLNNGREFWIVTGEAPGHGTTLEITEVITRFESNVCKAYVGVVDRKSADRAAIDAFLASFEVAGDGPGAMPEGPPHAAAESASESSAKREPGPAPHKEAESNNRVGILALVGLAGVLLGVGLTILWFAIRDMRK